MSSATARRSPLAVAPARASGSSAPATGSAWSSTNGSSGAAPPPRPRLDGGQVPGEPRLLARPDPRAELALHRRVRVVDGAHVVQRLLDLDDELLRSRRRARRDLHRGVDQLSV